ncbi:MAG: geranylgeranylglycerol-phosphate geranylgeranyltransferase [Candidatus Marinimicrobia bacterium]|nr:geranylgeranylglycerol-phosphate geranylgeranyltransferase [Candidatus Neomarinimicrobiota bacterium]
MKKVLAYICLMRPLNLLQGGIALIVMATLMDRFPAWNIILLATAIVWSYTGAGNAINDYCDAEIDKINRPERPIPQGSVSRKGALIWSVCLFLTGSLLAIPVLTIELMIILLLAVLLLTTYSLFFKMRPFLGNVVVSTILGMTFLFAASIYGDISKGVTPFFLAFGFNLIREIVKDIQDMDGDQTLGARTLPLKYGVGVTRKIIISLTLILMFGAITPYILHVYGTYYLLTLIFGVEFPLVYVIYSIRKDCSASNCARLAAILKGDIFLGLLAIFLGKF